VITFGIALPHYDGLFPTQAVAGSERTHQALAYAHHAEEFGFHEVWVSDHLWLNLAGTIRRSPDCWTLLATIAATTKKIRLGSLVTAAPLRAPAVLAHQVATVCDIVGDRLDVGLGAGWNEDEFTSGGIPFRSVPERLTSVKRSAEAIRSRLGSAAPPVWIGGKRSGILEVAGRVADGWNLAWDPTPEQYSTRWRMLGAAAAAAGRDSAVLTRSVGLTTVIGTGEADLYRRWEHLRAWVPGGHLDAVNFATWRQRGLIGTPNEVRQRLDMWAGLGVHHVVCTFGMPFGLFDDEQLALFATTARLTN